MRRIAGPDETAADLGYRAAALKLLDRLDVDRSHVDSRCRFARNRRTIACRPAACILQSRLGLSVDCAAFDYNLGCSGFTYGLWLAKGADRFGQRNEGATDRGRHVLQVLQSTGYCDGDDFWRRRGGRPRHRGFRSCGQIGASVLWNGWGRGASYLIVRSGGARHLLPCSQGTSTAAGKFALLLFSP